MTGYVFNLLSEDILRLYAQFGVYGTRISKSLQATRPNLYTLADYLTVREGALVFFFLKRTIYGLGRVVKLNRQSTRVASLCNFPKS